MTRRVKTPATTAAPASHTHAVRRRAAVLLAAVLLVYANSVTGAFVLDDLKAIVQNPQIREWWHPSGVLASERELPVAGRPVVNASFALNYALGGLDVRGYHLWNIAVHAACALVLFGIVRRTLELIRPRLELAAAPSAPRRETRPNSVLAVPSTGATSLLLAVPAVDFAFAVALLWALHPLNTEAVDYLTQRTETMMALFYLLTIYAGVRAMSSPAPRRWTAGAVAFCALGMGCKESMATAPLMVVLYDRVFAYGSFKQALRRRRDLWAGLAATWLILAALMWSGPRVHSAGFSTNVDPWTYLLNQTVMIVRYLRLAVWPSGLVANYGWPRPLTLGEVLPQALAITVLAAAAVVMLFKQPRLGFLGAWFFVTLAPASSVIPIATEVGGERRMYLPLMALIVLAVVGIVSASTFVTAGQTRGSAGSRRRPWITWALVSSVSAAFAVASIARNREYGSALLLAQTVVDRYPTPWAHHTLGAELFAAGRTDEAVGELSLAVPGAPRAYATLGAGLYKQARFNEAVSALETFVRLEPYLEEAVPARDMLGRAFAKQGQWSKAIEQYRLVLSMNPTSDERIRALGGLADAEVHIQAFTDAISDYRAYLAARPDDVPALTNLGLALAGTERLKEAVTVFQRAADLAPDDGGVQLNIANALFDTGDFPAAAARAERAAALRPQDPNARILRGRALAVQGQLAAAAAEFDAALRIDPNSPDARTNLARARAMINQVRR